LVKSQHSLPVKQLSFGGKVQFGTRQLKLTKASQKLASKPAQSASVVQGASCPVGGVTPLGSSVHGSVAEARAKPVLHTQPAGVAISLSPHG
jgi:hypothetical protein